MKAFISQWDPPPHFQLFYFNDRLEFCEFFEWKIKRINNADLFSQPPLVIFTKGANISGGHCICMYVCVCVFVCIGYYKLNIFWFMGSVDTKAALKLQFHSAYQYMCLVSHQWTLQQLLHLLQWLLINDCPLVGDSGDASSSSTHMVPSHFSVIVFLWILLYSSWSVNCALLVDLVKLVKWPRVLDFSTLGYYYYNF